MQRVYAIGTVVTWLAQSRKRSTFMKVLFGAPCLQGSVESSLRQGTVSISVEEGNEHDRFAVCNNNVLKRGDEIIGHVPRLRAVQRSWHLRKTLPITLSLINTALK